jgi:hypothetical protein
LERIFYGNDVAIREKILQDDVDVVECNIGTKKDPKLVNLSTNLSREQRAEYTELLK